MYHITCDSNIRRNLYHEHVPIISSSIEQIKPSKAKAPGAINGHVLKNCATEISFP